MINTLRLTHRLEAAGMTRKQAEAVSDAIAEELAQGIGARFDRLETRLEDARKDAASLRTNVRVVQAVTLLLFALTSGVLWQVFTLGGEVREFRGETRATLQAIQARLEPKP